MAFEAIADGAEAAAAVATEVLGEVLKEDELFFTTTETTTAMIVRTIWQHVSVFPPPTSEQELWL